MNNNFPKNNLLNSQEFESRQVELQSYPQILFVELTENCNFSCEMCRPSKRFDKSKNMSFDLFKRIANEFFDKATLIDLRGWGESTLLKDFYKYVDYASRYNARLRIVTNLSVANDQLWKYLAESNILITVSFDAAKPETFQKLRRGSDFERVLHNLTTMIEHNKRIGKSNDDISFLVTVQASAIKEIPDIIRIASKMGISHIALQPVHLPKHHPEHLSNCEDELVSMLKEVKKISDTLDIEIRLNAALTEKHKKHFATSKRCIHPWMYLYVNYLGQISYCDHLIGSSSKKYILGDLRFETFRDIWNSEIYKKLRQQHIQWQNSLSTAFEACNWCYKNRFIDIDDIAYSQYSLFSVTNKNQDVLF